MKVLNVNFSIDTVTGGGTAERTFQMSRFFVKQGVHCTVLTMRLDKASDIAAKALHGVRVIMAPCLLKRFYIPFISYKTLKSAVLEADIIHIMGHWTLLNAVVYWMAKKFKKPYVFSPAGALPIFGRSKIIKKLYNWLVGNKIIQNASGYMAMTLSEKEFMEAYGVPSEKIVIISNGIDVSCATENEVMHSIKSRFPPSYLLFLGRLNYIKGPDLLLQAFSQIAQKMPEYHLIYAGPDGGMQDQLMQSALSMGLEQRVHFLGYMTGSDKMAVYSAATLFVIPSRQEAMSIVVLEAGVVAKPVLITDQCGFPELEEINGGHIAPATVEGLAEGINSLLQSGKNNLENMGNNLKKFVIANYSWDMQITKIINFYSQILQLEEKKCVS